MGWLDHDVRLWTELRDEARRQEIVHGPDDRRRRAEPNEECAGGERLDRAENKPGDEPRERDEMGDRKSVV